MSSPFLILFTLFVCGVSQQKKTVTVGIAAVEDAQPSFMGFSRAGGAIGLALDRMRSEGIIQGFDFEFVVNYTECSSVKAIEVALEYMKKRNVDLVIAPPCLPPAEIMGYLSTYYQKSMLGWGFLIDSKFNDEKRFKYFTKVMPDSIRMMYAMLEMFKLFEWNRAAIFYTPNEVQFCDTMIEDVITAFSDDYLYVVDVVQKVAWDGMDSDYLTEELLRTQKIARIVLTCMDTGTQRRMFMKKVSLMNMISEEYVYISVGMASLGFGQVSRESSRGEWFAFVMIVVFLENNAVFNFRTSLFYKSNAYVRDQAAPIDKRTTYYFLVFFSFFNISMDQFLGVSNGMTPFWEDLANNHADDAIVKDAARRMLSVDINADDADPVAVRDFQEKVVPRVRGDPLYCNTAACLSNEGKAMARWARHLYDVFYLYGLSLNQSLTLDPIGGYSNASTLTLSMNRSFKGLTGLVTIDSNGTRIPLISTYVLNSNFDQVTAINFTVIDGKTIMTKGYTDEAATMWATRGGQRPLARPMCGYTGSDCPKPFWEQYGIYVIVGSALLGVLLIAFMVFIVYVIRIRKEEQEQQRLLWQIPHTKLRKPASLRQQQSKRSLQSGPSVMTGDSKFSESNFGNYEIFFLENDAVVTTKYPVTRLTEEDYSRFPQMRKLDHDNVNRFIGLSIDGAEYLAIWRMCSRGTLQEIIVKGSLLFDPFFMLCIMRDIAEGLRYLHNSFIGCHGRLRSECCMVTDSWQVKISDYGLGSLREDERLKKKRMLWVAPEHLRLPETSPRASKEGDIYSFAIIASEVVTRRAAWNLHERKEKPDELLYMLKKGGPSAIRPDLNTEGEINVAVLHLIRDCWSEKPTERPNADTLCINLKTMMPEKKSNLMDHMFNMLEDYTTTLELDVEDRTKELQEEKKKADVLLGRMLPRQVADRLKLGQTVEPEGFDSVTVFFSDVVKFTQLAAKCTPYQIVNLLNDLYNGFDLIIEEHSVYKVESIGDGYLCVSGLPARNGCVHIKEIAQLSLSFMKFVDEFRISAIPRERVQLRIGINSGPCVAGVVGLSMPRYCLFGDTVNTASRMESNGKPGHIHLSKEAHDLLVNEYRAEYETQPRGEVIIKGKGVMETFWLLGQKATFASAGLPEQNVERNVDERLLPQNLPLGEKTVEHTPPLTPTSESTNAMYRDYLRSNTIDAS
ncbi:Receptor-type guanylate cyclase gcy-5 [Trichostrongylus colubriformis]|uniref:Guanylate cyclase n=1 Tax=Trichostrongylus colubriformis TaxID=6319 RepID=A0AAN8FPM7_TRICO